ncbi:guanine nucleotide binding protein, alpha subunit [Favolaschia claudopus]|uniref:Guanine nucleotide binding protein, alpha subunit n=1 Tax=Favolaschia claudopus TaxID=2862362 RepID=A0AAW0EA85_9AGAR
MPPADVDPLAAAIAPPRDESPHERQSRVLRELAAKQVSDDIDDILSRERQQAKRQPKPVKILLLGQSESGKSTTLKNFQLMCEPKAFRTERASWRAIIQLNVLRSVRIILDAISLASSSPDQPSPRSSYSSRDSLRPDPDLLALRIHLYPLLELHDTLSRRLATPDSSSSSSSEDAPTPSSLRPPPLLSIFRRRAGGKELAVNSNVAWKTAFMRDGSNRDSFSTDDVVDWDDAEDPGVLLHERADDLRKLWAHPTVHAILDRQGIRLQESGGFFLDELDVVTSQRYVPTDDHILRARLKTLGVAEHRMMLTDPNGSITREFRIFDVGGQRSLRAKWAPYFDDMNCIIFLAPISAFDQTLEEEPEVNRLADSVALWTSVVSNKLLQDTNFILFLNKIDILQAKLTSGIRFADFVASYGRRPNDMDSTTRYMRKQFVAISKDASPVPRGLYCHLTNAVDTKSTQYVLLGIKDMLMQSHLKQSGLII